MRIHRAHSNSFRAASVLVAVLWCVTLLSVVVVGSLHSSRMQLMAAKNSADKIQAHYLALAGVEKAKALIFHDADSRRKSSKNHTGDLYNQPDVFRDVKFGRGEFRVFHQAPREQGGATIYGIADMESLLNVNTATLEDFARIKNMPPETAAAIIDWRDQDSNAQPGGAERDYYASLKPPYLPRNGDLQTIREMLLIRGVTPELLLGEDANQNKLLDSEEDDGNDSAPADNQNGSLDAGWSEFLCVNSAVQNKKANGDARVNVQSASEGDLTSVAGITTDIAKAIVAYRGRQKLENIADLLDVAQLAPERPNQNRNASGQPVQPNQSAQPQNSGPPQTTGPKLISEQLLKDIGDEVTADDAASIKGAININTASLAVLQRVNGITDELAQAIVSHRESSGYFANIAHLLDVPGMNKDIFKQISPRLTARSETFRILSEGRVTTSGARERIEAVVRISGKYIDTIAYRENL
jgi:competence ComEA-like helix-hairpin-helix protein